MKNYIKDKTALITGATSGIGRAMAFDFIKMGLNVILVARREQELKELQEELQNISTKNVFVYVLDVREEKEVNRVISNILESRSIDILINNAGLALGIESIDEGLSDNWNSMIDTNIKGLLYVSKAVIPQMRFLPTAHIVNIGSVAGKTSYPGGNVYCATKAAVHSIGESMNSDLFGTNIKVSTIAPGAVDTNFSNIRFNNDDEKVEAVYKGYSPLIASDISSAIMNIINTPIHVNIQYLDIMPTAQRNPFQLYRND